MSEQRILFNIGKFVQDWRAPVVARRAVPQATGGAYSSKYLANEDCAGRGPAGRYRMGGQVVYPTESFARWLAERASEVTGHKPGRER